MSVLSNLKIDTKIEDLAEKCARVLGYKSGFYFIIYDLKNNEISQAFRTSGAEESYLQYAISKMRVAKDDPDSQIINNSCRGVIRYKHTIWVVAGSSPTHDEAICSYLTLYSDPNRNNKQGQEISKQARKNRGFLKLNKHFVANGAPTVCC